MTDIEEIRAGYNLVELVTDAGGDLHHGSRGEFRCACPLHGGDNPNGFAIYESRGRMFWHCFTSDCGGGDEFDFICKRDGVAFADLMSSIREGKTPVPKPPSDAEILRRLEEIERKQREQERRIDSLEEWKKAKPWDRYHENIPELARREWDAAGIPQVWQDFWRLGGAEGFEYTSGDGNRYSTPTLTIPVFSEKFETVATVRHRLLKPRDPGDKYRPDIAGLGSHPFLADPDLGTSGAASTTIVTEGEKKAMVTFLTLDEPTVQVVGVPGKGVWRGLAERLKGQDVVIMLDPDADHQARQMAHDIGGARVVKFHRKIDDAIIGYGLDGEWLRGLLKTAQFVK